MSDDVRADIEKAMESLSATETTSTEAPAQAEETPTPAPVETAPEVPAEESTESVGRARDEQGRFAKGKPEAKEKAPSVTVKPRPGPKAAIPAPALAAAPSATPAPAPAVATEAFRAPQSWKPAAREAWAKLPPELQAALGPEVARREREIATSLQETAPARREVEAWKQVVAPYEAHIRAEGADPLRTVQSLLQTQHQLRFGTPRQKAAILAQVAQQFDVPIPELDNALASMAGAAPQSTAQEYRDPRFDQLIGTLQQAAVQKEQAKVAKAHADLTAFADKNEFFADVRQDMGDLMESAARRGLQLSLEDAYKRACRMNPDVWDVIQQREAAKAANAKLASTQQARNAASSVRTQPSGVAPSGNSKPGDLRSDIEAAMAAVASRR